MWCYHVTESISWFAELITVKLSSTVELFYNSLTHNLPNNQFYGLRPKNDPVFVAHNFEQFGQFSPIAYDYSRIISDFSDLAAESGG